VGPNNSSLIQQQLEGIYTQRMYDLGSPHAQDLQTRHDTEPLQIHHCWARLPPGGALASQIFQEIQELASCPPVVRLRPGWESRAAEAEYATAICLIQGFGCDQDTSLGCDRLIQSVASHCNRAMKCIFRILAALGKDLPEEHREMVALTARKAAIMSCDKRQVQDLAQLDSKLYDETMEELRTNQELAMEVFGYDLFMKWDIQDCDFIWETNAGRNTEIEDDGVTGTKLTWLHYAASRGWASLVERLIKSPGCDLNCVTDDGHWTPIFMACQGGHYDVVILLLKNGADPAIKSTTGDCCIHHLQRFGSEVVGDIAKQLVSRGIGVDSRSGLTGLTPLATACNLGTAPDSMDWISTLVDLGADVLLEGDDGFTPIDIVTMQLEPELLDILLRSSLLPEEKKSVACAKALYCLIRQPYFKRMEHAGSAYQDTLRSIVDILVSPPVLAAYETLHGSRNVLYDACRWGAADLIPLLLDRGFPVDDPRPQGSPPLFGAIRSGHVGIAATLIDRGADIATTDFHGRNILHVVAALLPSFLSNILTQLENRGCNLRRLVNAGTAERGFTPFDEAVQAENFDCANSILKLGAQYTEFTRRSGPGPDFDYPLSSSLFHAATSRTQLSYMLRLDPRPSMIVAENGMTIFHIMAACFDSLFSPLVLAFPLPAFQNAIVVVPILTGLPR
jgi:ankyrin repeat protein